MWIQIGLGHYALATEYKRHPGSDHGFVTLAVGGRIRLTGAARERLEAALQAKGLTRAQLLGRDPLDPAKAEALAG